jgi:hypothetical protein
VSVAPEKFYVIEDFISIEDRQDLISFIDQLPEKDLNKKGDGRLTLCDKDLPESTKFLKKYTPKVQEVLTSNHEVRTFFLSVYPAGSGMLPHLDEPDEPLKDDLAVVFILNDDYEGGELYFPDWDYTYTPKAGDAIFFPCNRYLHGVNSVLSGTRYSVPLQYSSVDGEYLDFLRSKND